MAAAPAIRLTSAHEVPIAPVMDEPSLPKQPGTALITGAGRRLGAVLADRLAREGWHIALHARSSLPEAASLAATLESRGSRACALGGDLEDPEVPRQLIAEATERLGPVRLLVNNASRFERDLPSSFTPAEFDRHMAINARAPALLIQAQADALPEDSQGQAINLLDQKLARLTPAYFSYTASKAALQAITEMAARAFAPRLRVNAIAPGWILPVGEDIEGFERQRDTNLLARSATPKDIADALIYLSRAMAVTGQTLYVDGGERFGRRPARPQDRPAT